MPSKPFTESYKYRYPDNHSYSQIDYSTMQAGRGYEGKPLRHGYIFGYKRTGLPVGAEHAAPGAAMVPNGSNFLRSIDYENSKMFQFNPPHLPISVSLMETESADVAAPDGNMPTGVGLATTTLEMYFNRTMEVNSSMAGYGSSVWKDIGVQIDLFDVLRVISGGNESMLYTGDTPDPDSPGDLIREGSLNKLTGLFYDAVQTGSKVQFLNFAVVYNPNLAVHVQRMTSFGFDYLQFTKDLVPTTLQIVMQLQIANMGTSAYVNRGGAQGAGGVTVGDQAAPPGTTPAPTGPKPGTNTNLTPGMIPI